MFGTQCQGSVTASGGDVCVYSRLQEFPEDDLVSLLEGAGCQRRVPVVV